MAPHRNRRYRIILARELGELRPRRIDAVLGPELEDLFPEPVAGELVVLVGAETGHAAGGGAAIFGDVVEAEPWCKSVADDMRERRVRGVAYHSRSLWTVRSWAAGDAYRRTGAVGLNLRGTKSRR